MTSDVLSHLRAFVSELRAWGVPVSTDEFATSVEACALTGLANRGQVRAVLRATLVKQHRHQPEFETLFDLFFPAMGSWASVGGPLTDSDDRLRGLVVGGLLDARRVPARVTEETVRRHSGFHPGRPVTGTYYVARVLAALDVEAALSLLDPAGADPTSLVSHAVHVSEIRAAMRRFELDVESVVRSLVAADRGPEVLAAALRRPLIDDADIAGASPEELARMTELAGPIARSLALRRVRRSLSRTAPVDVRRTLRRAVATGGTPFVVVNAHRRGPRPRIVVLADVSGSMARYAVFMLHLMFEIGRQVAQLSAFVFVDGLADVTADLAVATDGTDAIRRVNTRVDAIRVDGHSDYGAALRAFAAIASLTPTTTVIVVGDARANFHDPGIEDLRTIRSRVGQLIWINPEARSSWDTGDSMMGAFIPICDYIEAGGSVRALHRLMARIAP